MLGYETKLKVVKAIWIDSWHMHDRYMPCQGVVRPDGVVSVKGSYAASPGPDWGWWIDIEASMEERLRVTMYNVPPEGKADLAVKAQYARQR